MLQRPGDWGVGAVATCYNPSVEEEARPLLRSASLCLLNTSQRESEQQTNQGLCKQLWGSGCVHQFILSSLTNVAVSSKNLQTFACTIKSLLCAGRF